MRTATLRDISDWAVESAQRSFIFFCSYYLKKLFPERVPDFHHELASALTGEYDAEAYEPRGHAKSSIATTALPLYVHCTDGEPFTLLLSHTDQQITDLMRDLQEPVLNENGDYDLLHRDYDHLLKVKRRNDHELVFANGDAIFAASRGASSRGKKRSGIRPGLVVIDDLENEDSVASPAERKKTWDWFTRTVKPMPRPGGRIVWVGTLLHEDAAMPRAEKSGAFRVIKRKAIIRDADRQDLWDEWERIWEKATLDGKVGKEVARQFYGKNRAAMDAGAETLWPDRFPYVALRERKKEIGSFAFATEYQNEPIASENLIVRRDQVVDFELVDELTQGAVITYLKSERGTVVRLDECVLYITIDPAISQKNTADFFALGVMAAHPNGSRWLLDLVHDRLPFDRQIGTAIHRYVSWRKRVGDKVRGLGVETVMYQKALKDAIDREARKAGLLIPTVELRPATDKLIRLTRSQPIFEQGLVHVQKDVHGVVLDEVCGFTRDGKIKPTHDDAMDVVLYGLEMSEQKGLEEYYGGFDV